VADHLRELALRLSALALQTPDLTLHSAELLLHRADHALDLLRAHGHLAAGALLLGVPGVLEPLRERCAGLGEHVDRDRLQLLVHLLTAASHRDRDRGAPEQNADDKQQSAQHRHDFTTLLRLTGPANIPAPPDVSAVMCHLTFA
jgi:hypothetical protein